MAQAGLYTRFSFKKGTPTLREGLHPDATGDFRPAGASETVFSSKTWRVVNALISPERRLTYASRRRLEGLLAPGTRAPREVKASDFQTALREVRAVLGGARFTTPPWEAPEDSLRQCIEAALAEFRLVKILPPNLTLSLDGLTSGAREDVTRLTRSSEPERGIELQDLQAVTIRDLLEQPGWGETRACRATYALVLAASEALTRLSGEGEPTPSRLPRESMLQQDEQPALSKSAVDSMLKGDVEFLLLYLAGMDWRGHLGSRGFDPAAVREECGRTFRDLDIAALRLRGITLRAIGEAMTPRLTRQAVLLTCKRVATRLPAPVAKDMTAPNRLVNRDNAAQARRVRQEVIENPGISWDALAQRAAVDGDAVKSLVGPRGRKFVREQLRKRRARGKTWSDDQILAALQSAALYSYPLTSQDYNELVRVGQVQGPLAQSVIGRLGGWRAACQAAGVVARRRGTSRVYGRKWTAQELAQEVARFLYCPDRTATIASYDGWAREQEQGGDEVPSSAHLRDRIGPWGEVLDAGLDVVAAQGSLAGHPQLCAVVMSEPSRSVRRTSRPAASRNVRSRSRGDRRRGGGTPS